MWRRIQKRLVWGIGGGCGWVGGTPTRQPARRRRYPNRGLLLDDGQCFRTQRRHLAGYDGRVPPASAALGQFGRDVFRNRKSASWTGHMGFGRDRPLVVASGALNRARLAALGGDPPGSGGDSGWNSRSHAS